MTEERFQKIEKELEAIKKRNDKIQTAKSSTANSLAWGVIFIFILILIGAFATTTILIVKGFTTELEKLEKLQYVLITGGFALMGWLGGYYFGHSNDNK